MKKISAMMIGMVAFLCCGTMGSAQEITVKIMADSAPHDVLISLCNGEEIGLNKMASDADFAYSGVIPSDADTDVECKSTLIADWGNAAEQLHLRLPISARNKKLQFRIYHAATVSATLRRIEELEMQGTELFTSYKTYFEARRIYRKMYASNPHHTVTIRAARLWFDAAYRLVATGSAKSSYIAMDEEAVTANLNLAKSAPDAFQKVTSPEYIASMAEQAMSIGWTEISAIRELISDGNAEAAKQLNRFYLETYQTLNAQEQTKITKRYRIDLPLLESNMQYLQSFN